MSSSPLNFGGAATAPTSAQPRATPQLRHLHSDAQVARPKSREFIQARSQGPRIGTSSHSSIGAANSASLPPVASANNFTTTTTNNNNTNTPPSKTTTPTIRTRHSSDINVRAMQQAPAPNQSPLASQGASRNNPALLSNRRPSADVLGRGKDKILQPQRPQHQPQTTAATTPDATVVTAAGGGGNHHTSPTVPTSKHDSRSDLLLKLQADRRASASVPSVAQISSTPTFRKSPAAAPIPASSTTPNNTLANHNSLVSPSHGPSTPPSTSRNDPEERSVSPAKRSTRVLSRSLSSTRNSIPSRFPPSLVANRALMQSSPSRPRRAASPPTTSHSPATPTRALPLPSPSTLHAPQNKPEPSSPSSPATQQHHQPHFLRSRGQSQQSFPISSNPPPTLVPRNLPAPVRRSSELNNLKTFDLSTGGGPVNGNRMSEEMADTAAATTTHHHHAHVNDSNLTIAKALSLPSLSAHPLIASEPTQQAPPSPSLSNTSNSSSNNTNSNNNSSYNNTNMGVNGPGTPDVLGSPLWKLKGDKKSSGSSKDTWQRFQERRRTSNQSNELDDHDETFIPKSDIGSPEVTQSPLQDSHVPDTERRRVENGPRVRTLSQQPTKGPMRSRGDLDAILLPADSLYQDSNRPRAPSFPDASVPASTTTIKSTLVTAPTATTTTTAHATKAASNNHPHYASSSSLLSPPSPTHPIPDASIAALSDSAAHTVQELEAFREGFRQLKDECRRVVLEMEAEIENLRASRDELLTAKGDAPTVAVVRRELARLETENKILRQQNKEFENELSQRSPITQSVCSMPEVVLAERVKITIESAIRDGILMPGPRAEAVPSEHEFVLHHSSLGEFQYDPVDSGSHMAHT